MLAILPQRRLADTGLSLAIVTPTLLTHATDAPLEDCKSSVVMGFKVLHTTMFLPVAAAHAPAPRSEAEHTHQFFGHAARDPSHFAVLALRLTFMVVPFAVGVHSPSAFSTVTPGLPSPHNTGTVEVVIFATWASAYALLTASVPVAGARRLMIRLFVMSRDFRMMTVPFTSSAVVGAAVLIPIFPVLVADNPPVVAPSVPLGGFASVHAKRVADQMTIRMTDWRFMGLRTAPYG